MASSSLIEKNIVVIGCGGAGSQFTAAAAKVRGYKVTVITPFEYMEMPVSMTKAIAAGPEEHAKVIFPLLREEGVTYVIDSVASIQAGSLTTILGSTIPFDVAVIAVGQNIPLFYPDPADRTIDARKARISAFHSHIRQANSIVISGGGPVGTEVAADIKLRFKEKSVSVVHPQEEVLSMMRDPYRLMAHSQLEKMGVQLILSDRVAEHSGSEAVLKSGKRIPADLHIVAHALGGNATFLPEASRDNKGYARVDDTFRVEGFQNVFAVGDCSNYDPVKTFPRIDDQMPNLVANVAAVLGNKPLAHHVRGKSFMGSLQGPVMVAFGHGLPDGVGVGPDLPGCCGALCWFCCCFGAPCSTPGGKGTAKAKSDFNLSLVPKKGKGIHS